MSSQNGFRLNQHASDKDRQSQAFVRAKVMQYHMQMAFIQDNLSRLQQAQLQTLASAL